MEHRELPMYAYGFKCSCGVVSMGTKEDPAFFSDHLMQVFKDVEGIPRGKTISFESEEAREAFQRTGKV